jgi:hypothetical protein
VHVIAQRHQPKGQIRISLMLREQPKIHLTITCMTLNRPNFMQMAGNTIGPENNAIGYLLLYGFAGIGFLTTAAYISLLLGHRREFPS